MKHITLEEIVAGKKVRCSFILSRYGQKEYNNDFHEFVKFQKEKKPRWDFIDYHLYNISEFQYMPYNYFIYHSSKLLSKAVFSLLKQRPEFILSDELNIQLYLRNIKGWTYSLETVDKSMTYENACYTVAGIWLLNNIAVPFFYLKKIQYSTIVRYFMHELTHHIDAAKKFSSWDENRNYEKKIRNIIGRKSAYGINYIYNSMFDLRDEGLADFVARCNSNVDISGGDIRQYNKNLRELAFIRYKKYASKYFIKKISYGNLTSTGEYSIGKGMCLIIAMAIAKRMKSPFSIKVGKNGKNMEYGSNFDKLDYWLSQGITLYASNLNKEVISSAVKEIGPAQHYYFLKLYEDACTYLNISDMNKAMTRRRFYNLVNEAKSIRQMNIKRNLERNGFVYLESDIKTP